MRERKLRCAVRMQLHVLLRIDVRDVGYLCQTMAGFWNPLDATRR
jgi:hypothetical protein